MRVLTGLALFTLVPLSVSAVAAEDDAVQRCSSLRGLSIPPTSIGLPSSGATVSTAEFSDPYDPNGRFCKLRGAIHPVDDEAPDIHFQLNLPLDWNGKALHLGGAGYDGTLVTGLEAHFLLPGSAQPLASGYATFGSDSGHEAPLSDASFGMNDEALENFGGSQLKKTHDVAMLLIRRYFGQAPKRIYFEGNSQGGHEALLVVQRWPEDYDGVVSIHPVYNLTALQLSGVHLGQTLYRAPGVWLSPEDTQLIYDTVMRSCDGLDGLADGIISDIGGCRRHFDPQSLRCGAGEESGCLSAAQLETVRTFDSETNLGVTLADGIRTFAHWPLVEGGATPYRFGLGTTPVPQTPPGFGDAFIYIMGDQLIRYFVLRDTRADSLHFDPTKHTERLRAVSAIVDANSVALEPFRARGGKLLLLHGAADIGVPPQNTIDYYRRLEARFGADALREFVRFYVVPGFGHGDGPFVASWDWLGAIESWVEQGRAPDSLVAEDTVDPGAGRTRPLCEYPAWPRYRGSGDPDAAASFTCVKQDEDRPSR